MSEENIVRSFSKQGYQDLLTAFTAVGYETRLFAELNPAQQHVVVRHDVDFSLQAAVDIAEIEKDIGIRAHYFVLLRTEFYNLCSPSDWSLVCRLSDLGHDVGLHFDASQYPQDIVALEAAVAHECTILEAILGRSVNTISFHRPAKALLGLAHDLAGRLHAYHPRFFSDIAYCSDSSGCFRYGYPLDLEAFRDRKAMQLLTHPIWWTDTEREDGMTILDDFHKMRSALLRKEIIDNCKPYAVHISGLVEKDDTE